MILPNPPPPEIGTCNKSLPFCFRINGGGGQAAWGGAGRVTDCAEISPTRFFDGHWQALCFKDNPFVLAKVHNTLCETVVTE